jgi:carotenoid cleavage dioxygenase-like enzyme
VDDSSLIGDGRAAPKNPGTEGRFILEDIEYEKDVPRTELVRYVVDVGAKTYTRRRLSPRHVEFPSVAPSVRSKEHRFVYTTPGGSPTAVTPQCGVLKTDVADPSKSQIWLPPTPHEFCGEAIFTPRSDASAEDDGYLLTLCFNGRDGTSSLLVLDAQDVAKGPIATIPVSEPGTELPPHAEIAGPGHGLHATFVPGLAPTVGEVRAAENRRGQLGARFLADAPRRVDGARPPGPAVR